MKQQLQWWIYQGLLWLLAPVAVLLGRKLDRQSGQHRWRERFGRYSASSDQPPAAEPPIWLHAASVGEARAAGLLIKALREGGYDGRFVATTTTPTGAATIAPFLQPADQHLYAPYDLPAVVERALAHIRPRLLVVLEVEIWPNLWRQCQQRGIRIIVANARLAERSQQRYQRRLAAVWHATLARATLILAQSDTVMARFQTLGVRPQQLQLAGNLKFSQGVDAAVQAQGRQLRQQLGRSRPIWLAASTHEGEEQIALDCQRQLLASHPELLLVIVPRHPQRFDEVARLCQQSRMPYVRRSHSDQAVGSDIQVYLADTLGELLSFYAAADLGWVAGSFANVGGHNILEPAAYGCPILVGPKMRNFAEIMSEFLQQQALIQVQTPAQLTASIDSLLGAAEQRTALQNRAWRLLEGHRSAAERQAAAILQHLN